MIELICGAIGAMVLIGGGVALAGLLLGLTCDYAWRKLRDAYSLAQVIRIVRQNGVKPEPTK